MAQDIEFLLLLKGIFNPKRTRHHSRYVKSGYQEMTCSGDGLETVNRF